MFSYLAQIKAFVQISNSNMKNCSSLNAKKNSDKVHDKRSQLSRLVDTANNYKNQQIRNFLRAQINQDSVITLLAVPNNQSHFSEKAQHNISVCI